MREANKPEFKDGYYLLYGDDGDCLKLVMGCPWQDYVKRGFTLDPPVKKKGRPKSKKVKQDKIGEE